MKKPKGLRFSHTSNPQKGMGDYYGTGLKNKVGKVREGMGLKPLTPKKIKTPPKNLA